MATRRIHVMVTTNHHSPRDAQYYASREVRLTIASSDTRRLIQAALWGLRGIYREGFRYKKCGVVFLDLVLAAGVPGNLFLTPDSPRRQAVMAAMDKLNNRFGKACVRLACSGLAEARDWWTKADFLSPRRTTRWAELLTVCHCCYICYQLRWHNQKGGGMAKNVDDAFLTFAGWLKATTTETEKAASHRRSIQGRLTIDFELSNMFRSGSFGHDTGVSGYSDIDYFAVIPTNKLKKNSGTSLREVKESLQLRFPYTAISVRSPAVIVPFGNSPSEKHEIVPADYVELKDGHRVYEIPNRHDEWMRSSPAAHNKWVTDEHQRLNNKLKPLIRMIKAWNYYRDGGIRSFYLELRVTEYARGESTIIYKHDVLRALRHLHNKELAAMQDPKGISGYIYPCTNAVKPSAKSKVETALTRAEKAMEAENKGNVSDAFYWWNLVFNNNFPSYY